MSFYFSAHLSNFLTIPNATYVVSGGFSIPFMSIFRPEMAVCPVCHDSVQFAFYFQSSSPPDVDDCKFCNGTGLHPMPLTELYDELSYDSVDLP